jgi:hypothetical protein
VAVAPDRQHILEVLGGPRRCCEDFTVNLRFIFVAVLSDVIAFFPRETEQATNSKLADKRKPDNSK